MFVLELTGPGGGRRYPLSIGQSVLGRSPEADVHIGDPSLSRKHAELRVTPSEVWLRDLGSHNGTRVNGVRLVGEAQLAARDRVRCGDVEFLLIVEAPAAVAPTGMAARLAGPTGAPGPSRTVSLSAPNFNAGAPAEKRLATLLRVSELLAQPGEMARLQQRILDLVAEILPVNRAVLLEAETDGSLRTSASRLDSSGGERPYSESIVRYVLEHRVAARFDDALADQRLGGAASLMAQSIRCAMCAPLVANDEVLGVLYVDSRLSAHLFDAADLELLAGFANQAAAAIRNARLQAQLQQVAVKQNTLERFFPPATAAKLMETGGDLGVRELLVTAMFSDISGYTALSATLPPTEVVALLHAYFPPMARIVFESEGTLEKYIGDALLAVWGAPFGHPDDADRALEAAVAMHEAVARMRSSLPQPIDIHIGLHSGRVALANIGSDEYLQVATIGDATNTSARVCSVAGDGELVISKATADLLTRSRWPLTALPPTRVKGKSEPVELYRVEWR